MKLKNSVIFLFSDLPETVLEYSQPPRTKKKNIKYSHDLIYIE